jgi:hypothetical protein
MFPHPQDLLASASKVMRDTNLMVAAMRTRNHYPRSVVLTNIEDLEAACSNMGLVIKRDFSDSTSCTYLPPKSGEQYRRTERAMSKWQESKLLYRGVLPILTPAWISQAYNPWIVGKGELRAFVVGGKVRHVVHTLPDESGGHHNQFVDNFTPLDLLE